MTHLLSEADHRLTHVQPWAEKRLETLSRCTGQPVRALDFSDDRLGEVLEALRDDASWQAFEGALNQRLLRGYDLRPQAVRLDSTTASGYGSVTPEGLFQVGHSKDHRPDLPQVKVMLSTVDPLGLPVATQVVSGERADDPLDRPAVSRVRESLGYRGLLSVGDCKMAALETRAFLHAGGDFSLCPLPQTHLPPEEMEAYLTPVFAGEQPLTPIHREGEDGPQELIAEGYHRLEPLTAGGEGETLPWTERRLGVRSLKQAQAAQEALQARLVKAQGALTALTQRRRGKKRLTEAEPLRPAAEAILEQYQVQGLLRVSVEEIVHQRPVRRYRGQPARLQEEREVHLRVEVDETALQETGRRLGWRVYATNQPAEQLSLTQAVRAYRGEYLLERGFGRLKGKPLSLSPMYLQRDDHATGLIRLLSIGLRGLTLLEFGVRRRLAAEGAKLSGLYAGNPKRATAQPTAERLLEAFQGITLTGMEEPQQTRWHLPPLSELQRRILALLDFPGDIYTRLCAHSSKPP